jgi:tetratricopeptide (TPR) repeat protein
LQPGERERLSQYHASNSEAWLLYRQGLITIMPPRDLVRVQAARQLFLRAIEVDPSFAGGYVGQSFSHSTRVLFMNASQSEFEIKKAIEMAQKAILVDENFGGGYAVLSFAQALGGDAEVALRNARRSVAIQPGDAFSQFILGLNLIIVNRPGEGISHLQEAMRLDPLESRTPYLNVMGIAYYAAGDYSKALRTIEYNYEKGGPRGPHMDVFLAASSAQLGQKIEAQRIVEEMKQKYPGFPFKVWISRWLRDEVVLQQTLTLLEEAGLAESSDYR